MAPTFPGVNFEPPVLPWCLCAGIAKATVFARLTYLPVQLARVFGG